jgi:hypothetical protein
VTNIKLLFEVSDLFSGRERDLKECPDIPHLLKIDRNPI